MVINKKKGYERKTDNLLIEKTDVDENSYSLFSFIYYTFVHTVFLCFILLFITKVLFSNYLVLSESMESTIMTADTLVTSKLLYENDILKPERGDIILFKPTIPDGDTPYVKRVIGIGGDHIEFKCDGLYINGNLYEESYIDRDNADWLSDCVPEMEITEFDVPEDSYFMLGDNRKESYDSRYWWIGALDNGLATTKEEALSYCFVPQENIIARSVMALPTHQLSAYQKKVESVKE